MVRVNGTISEVFSISSGVRQGCVVAANFFTATDRILNNITQALTVGVNYEYSGQLITDLDYADDIVIFADLLYTLKDALFIPKTGATCQLVQVDQASVIQPLDAYSTMRTQPVTTTDKFTYLGSTIASNNSRFKGLRPPSSWRRPRGRPPLRWADQIVNDTQICPRVTPGQQHMIEHPGDHSFGMLRVTRRKQPKQASKQVHYFRSICSWLVQRLHALGFRLTDDSSA